MVGFLMDFFFFFFLKWNLTSGHEKSLHRKLASEGTFPAVTLSPTTFVHRFLGGQRGANASQKEGWAPGSLQRCFLPGYMVTLLTLTQL